MKTVYLASPFFNPKQIAVVESLEKEIVAAGFQLLSPLRSGIVLKDLDSEARKKAAQKVFDMNVNWIVKADLILAVIDDRDTGTVWEMGFGYAHGKDIYSYTDHDYGVNVMLQGCIRGHAKGLEHLRTMLFCIKEGYQTSQFGLEAVT
jgi:nucleoside 2-deoxyribosyltransferase